MRPTSWGQCQRQARLQRVVILFPLLFLLQRPFFGRLPFSLAARRASRYFLMVALATSLCLAQTIPNTGAAGLLQPGTGQSCLGRRRTGVAPRNAANLGGRPRRRGSAPPPTAAMTIWRARLVASASTAETSRPTKSSTSDRMLDSGEAVLGISKPHGRIVFFVRKVKSKFSRMQPSVLQLVRLSVQECCSGVPWLI
jgi:hypothetical protein